MPPPIVTVQESLVNFLANGWQIKGHTQGLGYQFTQPASPVTNNYGGWWQSHVSGKPWIAGHVLFFWVDFNPPIGKSYSFPPVVRETWTEKTYNAAALATLFGMPVVNGDSIGIRVQSALGLASGYTTVPSPFIELESEGVIVRFFPSGSWNIWTLPPGGHPNIQDGYFQIDIGPSVSVTIRAGARNLAPSLNLSFFLDLVEFGLFPAVAGPGEPEPEPPLIPDVCSTYDILYRAQEETGFEFASMTTGAESLWRYAKQLLSRCMASWYGNEVGDLGDLAIDLSNQPGFGGFGVNFGFNFGLGASNSSYEALPLGLSRHEAIWLVEARRISDGAYVTVSIVQGHEQGDALDPRAMLRDNTLYLVAWNTVWLGVYNQVRLRATAIHPTPQVWTVSLAPNTHIGPLFCRALELYMSRTLAHDAGDYVQARALSNELRSVTTTLMNQGRSQGWQEIVRFSRR